MKRKKTQPNLTKTSEAFKNYFSISNDIKAVVNDTDKSKATKKELIILDGIHIKTQRNRKRKTKKLLVHDRNPYHNNSNHSASSSSNSNHQSYNDRTKWVEVDSRMRLIQFHSDFAYYGTFTKKSTLINGRHPTRKDHTLFNYEIEDEEEKEEEKEEEEAEDEDKTTDSASECSTTPSIAEYMEYEEPNEEQYVYRPARTLNPQFFGIRFISSTTRADDRDFIELTKYKCYKYQNSL